MYPFLTNNHHLVAEATACEQELCVTCKIHLQTVELVIDFSTKRR